VFVLKYVLATVLALASGPASALTILQCTLAETRHNWVARSLVLALEPGARSAIVADDIGMYFTGKPATARINASDTKRLKFSWKVPKVTDSRGNLVPAMVYRATLTHSDDRIQISAQPLGYSARFTGRGSCRALPEADRRAFQRLIDEAR
jgi:hypothetical protein